MSFALPTDMRDVRVLVIGGRGFIGWPLVQRLSGLGAEVHILSRQTQTPQPPIRWIAGDAADPGYLKGLCQDVRPDIIYHLATEGRNQRDLDTVAATYRNDLTSVVEVLIAAVDAKASRLVLTASLEEPAAAAEPEPVSPYAAAKFAAGAYARMFRTLYDLPVVLLRPFMGYGPGQPKAKVVAYLIETYLSGASPSLSSGSKRVDWIYIDDLVEAFLRAAVAPLPPVGTIDLGTGTMHTVREVAELLHELIPGSLPPSFGAMADRKGDEAVRMADLDPGRHFLGWSAEVNLRDGLSRTIAQARQARTAA